MQSFGYYLGLSKQTEVLLLTLVGIWCTIFDASLLDLNSNLHKVWEAALDPMHVSGKSQVYIKYLLSGIILVRSFSVHLYLAFYIVMLWPAIFEERPGLLLPWLIVGAIKCLGMGFMSFCTGMFTCFAYGMYRPACLDFIIAQIIDHIPSFYMWFCVLSYYRELKACATVITYEKSKTDLESEIIIRRRKVRSMADNITLKHHCSIDEERHLISVSTIENIVQQLTTDLHRKTTRSLDSLLGVMAAEAEKEELMNLCDDLPSEEVGLTIQEKTAKLLKLSKQDIIEAQNKRKLRKGTVFTFSMLNMENSVAKEVYHAQTASDINNATYTTLSLPADNLRIIKREKGKITPSNFSKYGTTTEFMTNISETEIGTVLNYSSISLNSKNEQEVTAEQPPSLPPSPVNGRQKLKPSKTNDTVIVDHQPKVIEQKRPNFKLSGQHGSLHVETLSNSNQQRRVMLSKKSDVGCQASTLSRNILKSSFQLQRQAKGRPILASKKTSARTAMTKPSGAATPRLTVDNSKQEGIYKKVVRKEVKEIMPFKVEIPKHTSSFKTDGYTMAYNEKLRAKINIDKTASCTK